MERRGGNILVREAVPKTWKDEGVKLTEFGGRVLLYGFALSYWFKPDLYVNLSAELSALVVGAFVDPGTGTCNFVAVRSGQLIRYVHHVAGQKVSCELGERLVSERKASLEESEGVIAATVALGFDHESAHAKGSHRWVLFPSWKDEPSPLDLHGLGLKHYEAEHGQPLRTIAWKKQEKKGSASTSKAPRKSGAQPAAKKAPTRNAATRKRTTE